MKDLVENEIFKLLEKDKLPKKTFVLTVNTPIFLKIKVI
jgi:hypothetical protein